MSNEVTVSGPAVKRSSSTLALIGFLLISVMLPLMFAQPASAAPATPAASTTFGLNGGPITLLPLAAGAPAAAATPTAAGFINPVSAAVVLGAPVTTTDVLGAPDQTQIALGLTWGDVGNFFKGVVVGTWDCTTAVLTLTLWNGGACADNLKSAFTFVASAAITLVFKALTAAFVAGANMTIDLIFVHELGSDAFTPHLDSKWFLGQYSIMRGLALYLIIPLLLLVIIQSVLKGSMFFLLRAALVMLPIAVIGTVILVFLTRQLLLIADDMSAAIAHYVTDVPAFTSSMNQATGAIGDDATKTMGMFAWVWLLVLIIAAIVIFIELLLRQTGIYLAAFFMPLAFSAMVWPPSAKMAKRLVELLIGLIFSKVFIAAALSLGMAAMASVSSSSGGDPTSDAIGKIASGATITMLAAFAAVKILAIAPGAAAAAENRVANTQALWGKGQVAALGIGKGRMAMANRLNRYGPKGAGLAATTTPLAAAAAAASRPGNPGGYSLPGGGHLAGTRGRPPGPGPGGGGAGGGTGGHGGGGPSGGSGGRGGGAGGGSGGRSGGSGGQGGGSGGGTPRVAGQRRNPGSGGSGGGSPGGGGSTGGGSPGNNSGGPRIAGSRRKPPGSGGGGATP